MSKIATLSCKTNMLFTYFYTSIYVLLDVRVAFNLPLECQLRSKFVRELLLLRRGKFNLFAEKCLENHN